MEGLLTALTWLVYGYLVYLAVAVSLVVGFFVLVFVAALISGRR